MEITKGLRRIVLINNTKHHYDDVRLDGVTQITGSNNIGKTTFLNSIQFLFIDVPKNMFFDGHDITDSMRHYFPQEDSFILFELDTIDSGIVVVGFRGNAFGLSSGRSSNAYMPFVYKGEYEESDYVVREKNGKRLLFPEAKNLRDILNVISGKDCFLNIEGPSNYHDLISGQIPGYSGLTLVPQVKNQYKQFKEVFKQIVSSNGTTDQAKMKRMILACADSRYAIFAKKARINQVVADLKSKFKKIIEEQRTFDNKQKLLNDLESLKKSGSLFLSLRKTIDNINVQITSNLNEVKTNLSSNNERLEQESSKALSKASEYTLLETSIRDRRDVLVASVSEFKRNIDRFKIEQSWFDENSLVLPTISKAIESKENDHFEKKTLLASLSLNNTEDLKNKLKLLRYKLKLDCDTLSNFESLIVTLVAEKYSKDDVNRIFSLLSSSFSSVKISSISNEDDFLSWVDDLHSSINHPESVFVGKGIRVPLNNTASIVKDVLSKEALQINISSYEDEICEMEKKIELSINVDKIKEEVDFIHTNIVSLRIMQDRYLSYLNLKNDSDDDIKRFNELLSSMKSIDAEIKLNSELIIKLNREATQKRNIMRETTVRISICQKTIDILSNDVSSCAKLKMSFNESDLNVLIKILSGFNYSQGDIVTSRDIVIDDMDKQNSIYEGNIRIISSTFFNINTSNNINENVKIAKDEALSLQEEKLEIEKKSESFVVSFQGYIREILNRADDVKKTVRHISREISKFKISNLESVVIKYNDSEIAKILKDIVLETSIEPDLFDNKVRESELKLFEKFKQALGVKTELNLEDLFNIVIVTSIDGRETNFTEISNLHSSGTTVSFKILFYIILLRDILNIEKIGRSSVQFNIPFLVDEVAKLDSKNMDSIFTLASKIGMIPLLASPDSVVPGNTELYSYYAIEVPVGNTKKIVLERKNAIYIGPLESEYVES